MLVGRLRARRLVRGEGAAEVGDRVLVGEGRGGAQGCAAAVLDRPLVADDPAGLEGVVGDLGRRGAALLERLHDPGVHADPAAAQLPGVQGVADEGVREGELVGVLRRLAHEARAHRLLEPVEAHGVGLAGERPHEAEVELRPDDGGGRQRRASGLAEAPDPVGHHLADRLRHRRRVLGGVAGGVALLDELLEEERVAARAPVQALGDPLVDGQAGAGADQLRGLRDRQPGQAQDGGGPRPGRRSAGPRSDARARRRCRGTRRGP